MDGVGDLVARIAGRARARSPLADVVTREQLGRVERVVPMLSWGGFAEAAVDCTSRDGTVLLYESDVEVVAPDAAWKVDAPSLAAWWQAWLDGTTTTPTEIWRPRS